LPKIKPSAFEVLSTRAQLIDAFMTDGHIDFATGGCVADHVINGLGKDFALIQSDAPSASQLARLRSLVQAGIAAC
jgi:hypothetical protein